MTKTKWYAKPLYIVMALVLVLSFSLVTAVPAMATGSAAIDPIAANYDLYTPADVNTTITWNNATSVVSVNDDVGALATPADYEVVSDNLTILNAYLAAKLLVVDDSVALTINFDVGDPATFNITAIWTGPATYPVTLLQTTDIHSHVTGTVPFESYTPMTPGNGSVITGGFARLATEINQTRDAKTANGSAVLLVDSADWSMGTVYDLLWNTDPPYLKFLQAMKYDVTTLGNHEWDYGPDKLATMITAAQNASGFNVPIVVSNTFFDNVTGLLALQANGSIVTTYVETLPNGLKIGFIGLMGEDAVVDSPNAPPVTFKPDWAGEDKAYIQGIVDDLRNNQTVNVVIALSHSGIDPTTNPVSGDDIELAKNINGIDIIASGHLHFITPVIIDQANINTPNPTNITHIICSGCYTTNLAQLDFTATANGVTDLVLTNHPINDSIPGDSAINAMVLDMDTEIDTLIAPLGIGIADVEATMGNFSLSAPSSPAESGLGNLIADSLRYAGTEPSNFTIGAYATGMIRDPLIANQNVTFADLFRVVPLGITKATDQDNSYPGYPLLKLYLNGTEIWEVCRFNGIIDATGEFPSGFIHLSGIQYSYHYALFPYLAVVDSVKAYAWNDYNCTGTPTEDVAQDAVLYPVILDSYVVDMLLSPSVQDILADLGISIYLKLANGTLVNASNMLTARLDKDAETGGVQEEYAWSALLDYFTDPIVDGGLFGAIPADPYDLLTTSHKRIIVSGEAVSFVFDTIADQKTRVPFEITINAHDAEGIVAANYTGKATLTDLTGTISPTTTDNFTKGVWTGEVTITKAYTNNTITASHSEITGPSNDFDVYYTLIDYAMSGMPDFDQKQDNWTDNGTAMGNWTYCGPVAVANSLWWCDSKNEPSPVPPPTINDHYGLVTNFSNPWDDHDPQNVMPLVNNLSSLMNTGPNGTDVMDMQAGIDQYLNNTGYSADYNVTTVKSPNFSWIEEEVERGEDVVLLLGFWQWNGTWWRVGGHYVTVAGVNSNTSQLSISDPCFDNAELGWPGIVPVSHNHTAAGAGTHNDTQYVSHDIYNVTFLPCPGGNWTLDNYTVNKNITNFIGQNGGPGLPQGGYDPLSPPVETIIDYAVAMSATYTLTMAVNGNGTTTPAVGSYNYTAGTVVNITATAVAGHQFVNWTTANMSEIANATAASTTVTVDESKTVTANFALSPWWYWKPGNWTDYAMSGMPDFDQKQDNWTDNGTAMGNWTYCGPVAVANSLWWFDSKNEPSPVPPPTINDHYGLVTNFSNPWDDHDPQNVMPLVNNLSSLMNTGPNGTDVMDMQAGIDQYLNNTGYSADYNVTTVKSPNFSWIEEEVERCEDVVLLLGFWQWNGTWWRVGGHYVTVAGVNSNTSQIGLSDPDCDNAELGWPGIVPVSHNHTAAGAGTHNDTQYVSHDIYNVIFLPCPGGNWTLDNYTVNKDINNFIGQNWAPELKMHYRDYINQSLPVWTQIDYAVAVSPTAGATLQGHVDLQARPTPPNTQWAINLSVRFFQGGNEAAWSPVNVTTDEYGNFSYGSFPNGTYNIGVKSPLTTSRLNSSVVLAGNTTVNFGTLLSGDVNDGVSEDPDYIGLGDYTKTVTAYDSVPASGNWNIACDFNCDSYVGLDDYTLSVTNYDTVGEMYGM